jgi:hypothetical protein
MSSTFLFVKCRLIFGKSIRLISSCTIEDLRNEEEQKGDHSKFRHYGNISGYSKYFESVRPHMGLDGKTPAEKCGIKIDGDNKWLTLIQNSARVKRNEM